jgi:hypothetical protein
MKKGMVFFAIALIVAAGVVTALRLRGTAEVATATAAESKGDYKTALSRYCDALNGLFSSLAVPDVNRSKVIPPASWKRDMENYAAWVSGSSSEKIARTKRGSIIAAIRRTAGRVHADNFLSNASVKQLSVEQYVALWNSAYFAQGVAIDSGHAALAAASFGKAISIVKFSAQTSYTYEIALIDTVAGRRTTFAVYPEASTLVLAAPGTHLLICKSSYQPEPTQIWRSAPSVTSLTVPPAPSLVSFTLETQVLRNEASK